MALEDLVQKALYLGIGLASYAGEKAGVKLGEWSAQTQQAIEGLVARGEITTEEARRMVENLIQNQQSSSESPETNVASESNRSPRPIEILHDTDSPQNTLSSDPEISRLRQQAQTLQEQLQNLRKSQD